MFGAASHASGQFLVVEAERLVDAAEPEIPPDVLSRQALALLAEDGSSAVRAQGRRIDWNDGLVGAPISPHTSEGVTATYSVLWPAAVRDCATDEAPDPLAVHYVRIEERTRPSRLLAYYGRILPKHRERNIEDGVCLQGMHREAPAGVLRSIDVRITRAGTEVRRPADEEQNLVVEILSVTIRDPGGSASNGSS